MASRQIEPAGRTPAKFRTCIVFAYTVAALFYLPTGIFGYVQFGEATPQDILADPHGAGVGYGAADKWALFARLAILFNSTMCFTINFQPARSMLWSLCRRYSGPDADGAAGHPDASSGLALRSPALVAAVATGAVPELSLNSPFSSGSGAAYGSGGGGGLAGASFGGGSSDGTAGAGGCAAVDSRTAAQRDHDEQGSDRFIWWCAGFWIAGGTAIACVCRQLSVVFQLVGSVFGSFEVFFYPALFWWFFTDSYPKKPPARTLAGLMPAVGLVFIGVVMLVMGTVTTIASDL